VGIDGLKRAVFFDRDGVLNDAFVRAGVPHPPASPEQLRIADGAADAVFRVHRAGYAAILVTNQPDVARGTALRADVEAINEKVCRELGLDGWYCCMHDDADACECRKPKPGLLQRAAREHGLDLSECYTVGDRWKDVACGRAAGCATVFIDRDYAETPAQTGADVVVRSLREAIDAIAGRRAPA
jgi:D-glycero-D-manno-heptose 1,7-bisphosphate phosphatase